LRKGSLVLSDKNSRNHVLYQGTPSGSLQACPRVSTFSSPKRGGLSQPRPTAWVKRGPPSQPALKGRVHQSHT
jgi:hypothetical protein